MLCNKIITYYLYNTTELFINSNAIRIIKADTTFFSVNGILKSLLSYTFINLILITKTALYGVFMHYC